MGWCVRRGGYSRTTSAKNTALNDPDIGDLCARLLSFEGRAQAATWLRQQLFQRFPDSAVTQAAWVRSQVGMARFHDVVRWLDHTRDGANWPEDAQALLWETRFDVHLEFRDFFKAERAWIARRRSRLGNLAA